MKIAGIVAEYNPFHAGHRHHIEMTKKYTDAVVVVMSGGFVERGLPAVFDKWERAEMALDGGADLVCELPAIYATSGAENFATGALGILNALPVDMLSFGSESADIKSLSKIAALIADEPTNYKTILHEKLADGAGFAVARTAAIERILGTDAAAILKNPNDILALEYLKALHTRHSAITPVAVKRIGADHDTLSDHDFPSARAIRQQYYKENKNHYATLIDRYDGLIMAKLITADLSDLRALFDISEGMEFAIQNALETAQHTQDVIDQVSSKRIPKSRVRRALCALALNLTKENLKILQSAPPYLRVLGFNQTGRTLLRQFSDADIPIITNLKSNRTRLNKTQRDVLAIDIRATELRDYLATKKMTHKDYFNHPVIK